MAACQRKRAKDPSAPRETELCTRMDESGNIIFRNTDSLGGKHYLHVLYENGDAVSKEAHPWDGTHDHDDMGSIMIAADGQWLAIDPPYMGSKAKDYINKGVYHNKPLLYGGNKTYELNDGELTDATQTSCTIHLKHKDNFQGVFTNTHIYRNIEIHNQKGIVYYVVNDKVDIWDVWGDYKGLKICFNGNGNKSDEEKTFIQTEESNDTTESSTGRIAKWDYPCKSGNVWGLLTHTSSLLRSGQAAVFETKSDPNDNIHGSKSLITKPLGKLPGGADTYGVHVRSIAKQQNDNTRFQTILIPYRCNSVLPNIVRNETSNNIRNLLQFPAPIDTTIVVPGIGPPPPNYTNDTINDLFLIRYEPGLIRDTNPFNISGSTALLEADAEEIFMSRSSTTIIRPGACEKSIIPFKQAKMKEGTYLKYDDTVYISTPTPSTVSYQYEEKFKYKGYVSAGVTVTFYMPDMQMGYLMVGKIDGINQPTTHFPINPDSFMYVTVSFMREGEFTLEMADPCAADCYFPPTSRTIDSLFLFNIGQQKPLNHDLDIVAGAGNLSISNMSRMSICPDNVLVNKDSIVMQMGCAPERRWLVHEDGSKTQLPLDTLKYLCNRNDLIADRATNEFRNLILVNNRAALVLDSGSVTHIGLNSTILIQPGGTLLIKKGANVIIVDSDCIQNRGELLAANGSYVCVEEGAILKFYSDIDSANFYLKILLIGI